MGFPIAVGGRSSSSRPVAPPFPLEEDAEDGTALEPVVVEAGHQIAFGVDGHGLSATVSVSYYDMIRSDNGLAEYTVAELRVQISPLAATYSSTYRDMLHRIPLPSPLETNGTSRTRKVVEPSAVFASDGLCLACLIPYPDHTQSTVVIFQLRKPRASSSSKTRPPPPRPSYLGSTPSPPPTFVPVATNPRLLQGLDGSFVRTITSICDASACPDTRKKGPSVLLAGCEDGSILAIAYRQALVAGVLEQSPFGGDVIASLDHVTERKTDDGPFLGKLVALRRNGSAMVYASQLLLTTNSSSIDESHNEEELASDSERTRIRHAQNSCLLIRIEPLTVLMAATGTTPPFVRAEWMGGNLLALLVHPQKDQHVAAQVWAVYDDRSAEPLSTLTMTAGRLHDNAHGTFSLDIEQGDAVNHATEDVDGIIRGTRMICFDETTGCIAVSSVVISHANSSSPRGDSGDSLQPARVIARPYVCVWHWLTNVVGLTLVSRGNSSYCLPSSRLVSRLCFANDKQTGHHLVHTIAHLKKGRYSYMHMRKEIHKLGIISPAEVKTHQVACAIKEESSLIISSSSVTFPFVSSNPAFCTTFAQPSASQDLEVEWKESLIPSSYTTANGPPKIASIGRRRGVSIAVAASRGVCICDMTRMSAKQQCQYEVAPTAGRSKASRISHPKWKLFGRESEERGFRVLAMAWWEGRDCDKLDDSMSDDLLVAVIQLGSGHSVSERGDGPKYLACWSRRSLDFDGQLLHPIDVMASAAHARGILLPADFTPSSLSLLDDPTWHGSSTSSSGTESSRRAVLFLSSNCAGEAVAYVTYQLHLVSQERDDGIDLRVLCHRCAGGDIVLEHWSSGGTSSSIFLAGASFQFDLRERTSEQSSSKNEFIATLGIVRTPGFGLDVVALTAAGPASCSQVVPDINADQDQCAPSSQVSKYWLSDVVEGSRWCMDSVSFLSADVDSFFVWAIELCDGRLLSWLVPYFNRRHGRIRINHQNNWLLGSSTSRLRSKNTKRLIDARMQLLPPFILRDSGSFEDVLTGMVCFIGDASTWINDSSAENRSEFTMGCVPNSSFGCILSAGQNARKFHRIVPGQFDSSVFAANFLDHEVFSVGECILTSPAFVSSLFASFLASAGARAETQKFRDETQLKNGQHFLPSSDSVGISVLKRHALFRLRANPNKEVVTTALRLLLLRMVEILSKESAAKGKNHTAQVADSSFGRRQTSFLLAMSLFAEIVDAVRYSVTPVQLVSLFLGVGRQIEPHCCNLLFPLPPSVEAYGGEPLVASVPKRPSKLSVASGVHSHRWRTVEDLYSAAVRSGSLSISSSALPLCTSKPSTNEKCTELLHHCLHTLEMNATSKLSILFDTSGEERQLLRDLFRFGLKLQDADPECNGHMIPDNASANGDEQLVEDGEHRENMPQLDSPTGESFQPEEKLGPPMPLRGENSSSSVVRLLFPFFWSRESKKKRLEEQAIYEAASLFILSGFEENEFGNLNPAGDDKTTETNDSEMQSQAADESNTVSVVGMIARWLLSVAFGAKKSKLLVWRTMSIFASLLLGRETLKLSLSSSTEVDTCRTLSSQISLKELVGNLRFHNGNDCLTPTVLDANDLSEDECFLIKVLYLKILECKKELNKSEASWLVDLILVLLSKQKHCTEVQADVPCLITLGLVTGHVAGRKDEILDFSDDTSSDLKKIYLLATSKFPRTT